MLFFRKTGDTLEHRAIYEHRYSFRDLTTKALVDKIQREEYFTYAKINHGFWETLLQAPDFFRRVSTSQARELDFKLNKPFFFETGFIQEFTGMLQNMPAQDPNFLFALSPYGWKDGNRIEGTPKYPDQVYSLIHKILPKEMPYSDGLLLKNSCFDQSIIELFNAISSKHLIVVGPSGSENFADFINAENSTYIPIHSREERGSRLQTLEKIRSALSKKDEYSIIVFQAGILAPYWSLRLHGNVKAAMIDLGLIMDLYDPCLVLSRNWGKAYRAELSSFYNSYRPKLSFSPVGTAKAFDSNLRSYPSYKKTDKTNTYPIPFLENKPIDKDTVDELLQLCERDNHWANDGPVCKKLEKAIHAHLKLSDTHEVVMCSSCTVALNTLVNLTEIILKRKPVVLCSSFGFYSTRLGPFSESVLVDSNRSGFLDHSKLKSYQYDVAVFTNIFGLKQNIDKLIKEISNSESFLIVDNAAGFESIDRSQYTSNILEAISFHHTKPFGFGEGGCMIVSSKYAHIVRSLINFGVGLDQEIGKEGLNGKISDVACAYIYQRLRTSKNWKFYYSAQARRIDHIALNAGLTRLVQEAGECQFVQTVPGQIPYLSSRKISWDDLENPVLNLRKYYRPHDNAKNANFIYDHIINIPTHPGLAVVPDQELYDLFISLA